MNWLLISIIFLVFLVIIIKAKEMRHHLFYRALALLAISIVLSFGYVWFKGDINLTTYDGFLSFGRMYYGWLSNIFGSAKEVTGYAIQHNWGLNNTVSP